MTPNRQPPPPRFDGAAENDFSDFERMVDAQQKQALRELRNPEFDADPLDIDFYD